MVGKVKFVLNRKNFREQVLRSEKTADILREKLGQDAVTDTTETRARARVYGSMSDEAQSGSLSRRLGGV